MKESQCQQQPDGAVPQSGTDVARRWTDHGKPLSPVYVSIVSETIIKS